MPFSPQLSTPGTDLVLPKGGDWTFGNLSLSLQGVFGGSLGRMVQGENPRTEFSQAQAGRTGVPCTRCHGLRGALSQEKQNTHLQEPSGVWDLKDDSTLMGNVKA